MFRLDLEYRVNRRPISAEAWRDAMAHHALEKALKKARTTVESIRCDEHHRAAILRTVVPAGSDDVNFTYSFCCEALKAKLDVTA
jgi:hypothetical protein